VFSTPRTGESDPPDPSHTYAHAQEKVAQRSPRGTANEPDTDAFYSRGPVCQCRSERSSFINVVAVDGLCGLVVNEQVDVIDARIGLGDDVAHAVCEAPPSGVGSAIAGNAARPPRCLLSRRRGRPFGSRKSTLIVTTSLSTSLTGGLRPTCPCQ